MTKKFDYLVFIGRFQPPHVGHIEVINQALQQAERVLVLIGSAGQPRTSKNPWSFEERKAMMAAAIPSDRVSYLSLSDVSYNDQAWANQVQNIVAAVAGVGSKIGLIGHIKDASSYYLKMFPQWELVEHAMNEQVSATDIRRLYFEGASDRFLSGVLPHSVLDQLIRFRSTDSFALLEREYTIIKEYKKMWERAPYPPTFVTTDAVVVQSGHILLIQRDAAPGEGLWALPGGFLNQSEYLVDGMIRELREETRLKVPAPVLKGCIRETKVFDRPDRSLRGRTITHAFHIELPAGDLPPVKGSDDARAAKWVPFSAVRESEMFEDHYAIIQYFLGI